MEYWSVSSQINHQHFVHCLIRDYFIIWSLHIEFHWLSKKKSYESERCIWIFFWKSGYAWIRVHRYDPSNCGIHEMMAYENPGESLRLIVHNLAITTPHSPYLPFAMCQCACSYTCKLKIKYALTLFCFYQCVVPNFTLRGHYINYN